ncbi:MAG: hypothetical protein QXP04_01165, partial [Candidatus Nanoarchaeia archaeon]|nr:hypothetical protein [Candidatus Jingweiarchaeum tengchongense]
MNPLSLFLFFPLEVGKRRKVVYNKHELLNEVRLLNGIDDVFVSLYSGLNINKIFFDFDSKNLEEAFADVRSFVQKLNSINLPYIPIFSGRKGFHIYIPLKNWVAPNEETAKAFLREVQERLAGEYTTFDRHVAGDVRRLVRFPNTLNGNCYATPLPYDFVKWDISEIIDYAKSPHEIEYNIPILPEVFQFFNLEKRESSRIRLSNERRIRCVLEVRHLKELIRPCIFEEVIGQNPPHMVRFDMVTELKELGYDIETIVNLCSSLGWIDFDR